MKFLRLLPIAAATLALIGCGEGVPDEPLPLPPMEEAQPAPSDIPQEVTDQTVVEFEPDIDMALPMESGLPMADAAPMTDDFGGEEVGEGPD